ncbi:MAG: arginine N-succinyltransferase, partial [Pirellula sp.]
MLIVREVQPTDLDALWDLVERVSAGMTSLQISKDQLADRIERSHFAFLRTTERPEGAPYVFVMQDTDSSEIIGTSCVFSKTGGFEPFYAYRIVI